MKRTRADQNTGGTLLEFPMRTAMQEKSRVSSAISGFSTVALAQWVRRWDSGHRVVQAEGSSPCEDTYQFFAAMIFISVLLSLMDFIDIVI